MKTHTLDASNKSLGRLASQTALLLRGKDEPLFDPAKIVAVAVTISNLDRAKFTGTKLKTKLYHRYSGYHGGIRTQTLEKKWSDTPKQLFRKMVYDMLPKNRQRDRIIKNLKFN